MRAFLLFLVWQGYRIARPIFFLFDCEKIHAYATRALAFVSRFSFGRLFLTLFSVNDTRLATRAGGIEVNTPLGLAAGYDYDAYATRALPLLGFGFTTLGTLTFGAYAGNPSPRLGRLVRARSLVVNKGFKNDGVRETLARLATEPFSAPLGVSVGQTNKPYTSYEEQVQEIEHATRLVCESAAPFSWLEVNISCPNLTSAHDWYDAERLSLLLSRVLPFSQKRGVPTWVKMPISCTDEVFDALCRVCKEKCVSALVVGNLQKKRDGFMSHEESARYTKGNLSGAPTQKQSDVCIARAYRLVGDSCAIVGCGGIFSADDAYRKIRLGASLVALVTGLIWEGPALPARIAHGLSQRLARDGFTSVSEAVGVDAHLSK
jgi:dihydroorotate dehydrogenase subfamily 2